MLILTGNSLTAHRFNDHTVHGLYKFLVTAPVLRRWMELGNIAPNMANEPTSLAFPVNVLTINTPLRFPDATSLPKPTCLCDYLPYKSVSAHYYYTLGIYLYNRDIGPVKNI